MEYTVCSVCGKKMKTSLDLSGKPYAVQTCSDPCLWSAWGTVTASLKKGVRPNYNKGKRKNDRLTEEEKEQIIEMYQSGIRQSAIARELNRSASLICLFIKNVKRGRTNAK